MNETNRVLKRKNELASILTNAFVFGDYGSPYGIPKSLVVLEGRKLGLTPSQSWLAWNNFVEYGVTDRRRRVFGKKKPTTRRNKKRVLKKRTYEVRDLTPYMTRKLIKEYLTGDDTIKFLVEKYRTTYSRFSTKMMKELYRTGKVRGRMLIDPMKFELNHLRQAVRFHKYPKSKQSSKIGKKRKEHYTLMVSEILNNFK